MMTRSAPPPLTPMSKETTSMRDVDHPWGRPKTKKLGLGSALAKLGGTNRKKGNLFLEEPMEEGLGVEQFEDDSVYSAQAHLDPRRPTEKLPIESSPSEGKQPRRASLIEKSRQFQDKFVKIMQDYSTYTDIEDVEMGESNVNNFPTRETDLRHVDQRINLMNASLKRHENYEDEEDDYLYDEEEDDVYENYTEGYKEGSEEKPKRKPSIPPKKAFEQEKNGDEGVPQTKMHTVWERYRYAIRWTILVLLFVVTATWLLMALKFFTTKHSVGFSLESAATVSPADKPVAPYQTSVPGSTPGETYQRKHDLESILEETLFPEAHQDADLMDLNSPFAGKTFEWMITYDLKSKILLDQYHGFIGDTRLESSVTKVEEDGKDRYSVHEDFDDPKHHYKTKIVDRYVEGVYYFRGHPDCSPATAILE